jgi:hypothetical protein
MFYKSIRSLSAIFCMAILLSLTATPALSQELQLLPDNQESTEQTHPPLDVTNLQLDWWNSIESTTAGGFKQRTAEFEAYLQQEIQGLEGEDLAAAQNLISRLKGQVELLILALQHPEPEPFEPIPTQEVYTLDELLELREQWRDTGNQQKVPELRIDELRSQSSLLERRRDDLLEQYDAVDVNSPARLLLGLERVAERLDYELTVRNLKFQEKRLADIQQQEDLLDQQLEYAQLRLDSKGTDWTVLESETTAYHQEVEAAAKTLSVVQHQLLAVLSAPEPKPSLELLRKQQLTRAAASRAYARVQENLDIAKTNWYRFHTGVMESGFDINASRRVIWDLIDNTGKQFEVWTSASQTTLVTPLPDTGLNARKNVELAHDVAQETLSIINTIQSGLDDLNLVQQILTTQMVETQSGLKGVWTRLVLLSGNIGEGLFAILDFDLFHIGDAPVTPGRIIQMLLIIGFGFLLSWTIRHLLERLRSRRKYAKSPVMYTLGRILHYIIIIAAVFAALGTIGLDFKNFALIAGALSVGIDFGVAYGSDKEMVKQAALEAAAEVDFILKHTPGREAQIWMTGFGDSSLDFQLLAWVSKSGVRRPNRTRSQFLWALETKLTEKGIEIPFPQRDLHLRSGFPQDLPEGNQVTEDKA